MKEGNRIIITNLKTGEKWISLIVTCGDHLFQSEEGIVFCKNGTQFTGDGKDKPEPTYSCELVAIDPASPGRGETVWTVNGNVATTEEIRQVFKQVIGFQIFFKQYSSTFKGVITACDGVALTMVIRKDGDWHQEFKGTTYCSNVQSIDFPGKFLTLFEGRIVSMSKNK